MTDLTRGDIESILGYFKKVILNNAAIANEAVQGASAATLIDKIQSLALEAFDRREKDVTHVLVPSWIVNEMAKQKLSTELSEEDYRAADFQGAYDTVVQKARAMLAAIPQKDTGK